ncbi:GNAT family N-acetyltransferase [Paenibacillus soyae]|uniref:GNAT family N-acetyltransferase n=1 Tax=Paenibacillus soyae TaxID=2969249 RepID=A0A9X2S9K8_9BACL|nr:GNAT family N-acetyltransferase [Paenibacillus soyae]MCR2805549.1 GNAT family N-acetyltransferase [Paenibacillus soyae]
MLLTRDIAQLLEQSEIDYMSDRMAAMAELPGNPHGVETARFGSATAFYSRGMPWPMFNNVKGALEEDQLASIVAFYEERERSFEFHISPLGTDSRSMERLARIGFYQSGFHATMYTEAAAQTMDLPSGVQIRELRDDEFMTYAAIHCEATGLSMDGQIYVAENNRILAVRPGWRYYIAFCEEQPAAVAAMYRNGGSASCTFAATLPAYRGRGLQTALLRRRIADAYSEGCEIVVGQCAYGSTSHANMERAGMRLGYSRATWKRLANS